MNTVHDYETLGLINFNNREPVLLESWSGTEIVRWHGKIEQQVMGLLADAEKGRNWTYADKLREFLTVWRQHEITGSINRETLETLSATARLLGVDNWNLSSYFLSLATQLKVLIASEEQLPRGVDMNQNEPMAGGGGAGRGAPPMSPAFGPEEEAPPGAEGGVGGPGGAGGGGGAGSTEPVEPGAEGAGGVPPEPGMEPEGAGAGEGAEAGPMGPAGGPEAEVPEEEELERI